ncbi:hypothetical protein N656DRAFT_231756 [Canariomyces notabilis]|uniref:Uncharacterized protein n=1 Tax=Canariomyces notabilis TaxID=2074819 RepID=A0AAN6TL06_9PEZI|nr:hypothetical protein N656DRAFT_231756 [Canariomyces arenarius]
MSLGSCARNTAALTLLSPEESVPLTDVMLTQIGRKGVSPAWRLVAKSYITVTPICPQVPVVCCLRGLRKSDDMPIGTAQRNLPDDNATLCWTERAEIKQCPLDPTAILPIVLRPIINVFPPYGSCYTAAGNRGCGQKKKPTTALCSVPVTGSRVPNVRYSSPIKERFK